MANKKYVPLEIKLEQAGSNKATVAAIEADLKKLETGDGFRTIRLQIDAADVKRFASTLQSSGGLAAAAAQATQTRLADINARGAAQIAAEQARAANRQTAQATALQNQLTAIAARGAQAQAAEQARATNRATQQSTQAANQLTLEQARAANRQAAIAQQNQARLAEIQARGQAQIAAAEARASRRATPQPGFLAAVRRYSSTVREAGESIQQAGYFLTGFSTGLITVGRSAVKAAIDIDASINTLKAFTGSAEKAEARFRQLVATASKTPGLTTGLATSLDAQLRVAGASQGAIDKALPAIGRLNAVSPLGDPSKFASNLVQLISQNFEKTDLKELVGQSPIAGQLIQQVFKVDSPTNAKAIRESAKKLGIVTVDQFFLAIAEAAEKNQALANVSESLATRFAKLSDRVTVALRPLGLSIINALGPLVEKAVVIIERLGVAFNSLSPRARTAVVAIGALAIAIGPAVIGIGALIQSAGALGNLVSVFVALGGAGTTAAGVAGGGGIAAIGAALAPLLPLIAGVGVAVGLLAAAWATDFGGMRKASSDAFDQIERDFQKMKPIRERTVRELNAVKTEFQNFSEQSRPIVKSFWEGFAGAASIATKTALRQVRVFLADIDLLLKGGKYVSRAGSAIFGSNPDVPALPPGFIPGRVPIEIVPRKGPTPALPEELISVAEQNRVSSDTRRINEATKAAGRRAAPVTELARLSEQLKEVTKQIEVLQNVTGKEFEIKLKIDAAQEYQRSLEQIIDLRRQLGEPVKTSLPSTADAAAREVGRLTAFKEAREKLAAFKPVELFKENTSKQIEAQASAFERLSNQIKSQMPETTNLTIEESLAVGQLAGEFAKLNPLMQSQIRNQAQLADTAIKAANAQKQFEGLQGQINGLVENQQRLTAAQTLEVELQTKKYMDLSAAQIEALRAQAQQVDAANLYGRQLEEARQQYQRLSDTVTGTFETLFERGPKAFFNETLALVKRSLARIAAEITSSTITKQLSRLFSLNGSGTGTGAFPATPPFAGGSIPGSSASAGSNPLAIVQQASAAASGRTGGGSGQPPEILSLLRKVPGIGKVFVTPTATTPPLASGAASAAAQAAKAIGNKDVTDLFLRLPQGASAANAGGGPLGPIQQAISGQGGIGALLKKIPGIGRLFGSRAAAAQTGSLASRGANAAAQAGNAVGKPAGAGALASLGAGGLLFGGGLAGSLAGRGSAIGGLLGNVGGTLLAGFAGASGLFGSSIAGLLPAFFSNPFTAIIGGALIGGALLAGLFKDRDLKAYRNLIKTEYAIDVKNNEVLKQVREIGKQLYGKNYKKFQFETIKSSQAKEVLASYADATGQRGNGKLFRERELGDEFNPINRFTAKSLTDKFTQGEPIRRELGGPIFPGRLTLVGERRPELAVFGQPGEIFPSIAKFEKELLSTLQARAARGGLLGGQLRQLASQIEIRSALSAVRSVSAGPRLSPLPALESRRLAPVPVRNPEPLQGEGGGDSLMLGVMAELTTAIQNLKSVPAGHVVEQGLRERPGLATRDVATSLNRKTSDGLEVRDLVNRTR